jgi:hypothetical protein
MARQRLVPARLLGRSRRGAGDLARAGLHAAHVPRQPAGRRQSGLARGGESLSRDIFPCRRAGCSARICETARRASPSAQGRVAKPSVALGSASPRTRLSVDSSAPPGLRPAAARAAAKRKRGG